MAKTRAQKQVAVQNLTEKLNKAKSVVFADYKGLTMSKLNELRKNLKIDAAEFSITKNSSLNLALKHSSLVTHFKPFTGPTATMFAYDDEITPIKILVKAFKDFSQGQVKLGFLDGKLLNESEIVKLALLPTKSELWAKTVSVLVSPLQGIVSVLQANLQNLVYALNEIKLQRGGE